MSDLLTRIIPGVVISIMFFLPIYWGSINSSIFGVQDIEVGAVFTLSLIIFTVFSLVVGEFVDLIRRNILSVPYLFRKIVYDESGNRESLAIYQKLLLRIFDLEPKYSVLQWFISFVKSQTWDLKKIWFDWSISSKGVIQDSNGEPDAGFLKYYREQMNINDGFTNSRILYHSLYSYMDNQMSSMTQQYQIAYEAVANFRIASAISVLLLFMHYLFGFIGGDIDRQVVAILLFLLLSFIYISIRLLSNGYSAIEKSYIESLMIDYLMLNRLSDTGDKNAAKRENVDHEVEEET